MRIGLIYFSGTGNTRKVAELFEKYFKSFDIIVDLHEIDKIFKNKIEINYEKYDVIGFGYPVYGSNLPRLVREYFSCLPIISDKRTFLFKTAGRVFLEGGSTSKIRNNLNKMGFNVMNESLFPMGANSHMVYDDELIKELYLSANDRVKKVAEEILLGNENLQENKFKDRLVTSAIENVTRVLKMTMKKVEVKDSCILCGKCVRECPVENIEIENNKILFGDKCMSCMRCFYNCPKNALYSDSNMLLKNGYNLEKVIKDENIKGKFLSENCKGDFKKIYDYIYKK